LRFGWLGQQIKQRQQLKNYADKGNWKASGFLGCRDAGSKNSDGRFAFCSRFDVDRRASEKKGAETFLFLPFFSVDRNSLTSSCMLELGARRCAKFLSHTDMTKKHHDRTGKRKIF
jgi:hypothetical protein